MGSWGRFPGSTHANTKEVKAVGGVNLAIEPGELVAFLGPDGAV